MFKRVTLTVLFVLLFTLNDVYATVADSSSVNISACNNSTTAFTFTFGAGSTSELKVTQTTSVGIVTTLSETTDYTVACTNDDCSAGGTVTTVATCPSGSTITIERNVPFTQNSDFTEGMPTLYETFEQGLDKLTRISQQLRRGIAVNSAAIAGTTPTVTSLYYSYLSDYDNITAALADVVGTNANLVCNAPVTLEASTTIPATVNFIAMRDCLITTTGYTLTFSGSLSAGPYQIFSGSGTVTGLKESYPEWWGIDGTADNTEITYAANSLSAGGILHIDASTYNIADIVYLPDYVTVRGAGYNSVLKAIADFGDKAILRTSNKTGVVIENLRIDGNRTLNTTATQHSHAIAFTYAKKSAVRGCWLDNMVGDGVYIGEGSEDIEVVGNWMNDNYRNGVSDVGGYRHTIEGNIITSSSTNIVACIDLEPNGDDNLEDILVKDNICYITGEKPYGIDIALDNVDTDSNLKNIQVVHNIIHGDGTNGPTVGIYGYGARNVTVVNNEVYTPKTDGIYIDDGVTNASHSCSVKGNTVYSAPRYGIISKADNTPIQNNIVHAVAGSTMTHGIYVRGVSGLICTGNDVYIPSISGTDTYGFLCETGTTTDFIIANNRIYSDTVANNQGIWIADASLGQIYGNIIKNFFAGVTLGTTAADSVWAKDNDYSGCTTNYTNSSQKVIGTINLSTRGTSLLYSAAGAVTATLPDGDSPGQIKVIRMSNATAESTVKVSHHTSGNDTVFTFNATTDRLVLVWDGTTWATVTSTGI